MDLEQRVNAALFNQLIANSAIPLIGSAVGGVLVGLSQIESSHTNGLLIWLCLLFGSIGIRFWLTRRCRAQLAEHGYDRRQAVNYAITTSLSGIAWGFGGLLLSGATPLAMVVTITAIQAMVMGGVLTLGAFIPSFLAFALPAILPMIVVLGLGGSFAEIVLALYSAIFLLLMIGIVRRFNNSLRHTWQLHFEKEDLVRALTAAHDNLSVLAKTDALTGIANRRCFDEVLAAELVRLHRSGSPLSLIILDVDHFKSFNDHFGHVVGDQCLKSIADVFQRQLHRPPDLAARYGGEEFAGILPETGFVGAVSMAEKIRSEVLALAIHQNPALSQNFVSVSLGVITLDCSTLHTPIDVVAMADRQLYRAKSEGRNRVVSWNGIGAETS